MLLSLQNDKPESAPQAELFRKENVFQKLLALDAKVRKAGLGALDGKDPLVAIGTESDAQGRVTKNSYGVLNLSWQAEQHPEWGAQIRAELEAIKRGIKEAHGLPLKFLIWAGMGGSAEDKSMYNEVGLLGRGIRCFVLDSTDPAKLAAILEAMQDRSGMTLAQVLRSTLVVGMAMGMTSYEPVVNLEKLHALYQKQEIDSRPNFVYMTLPGSLLDQFASRQGYRRIELQPDQANTTAGRHSAPLTRGSLYPLGLARVDLAKWIEQAVLKPEDVDTAWRLAAFLHTQARAGRNKVTLLLPKKWAGAGLWTKQDFEESLGKSEEFGLKIVIGERVKLANYRSPKEPQQDRVFLAVSVKGQANSNADKVALLRRAGYPVATLTLRQDALSRYLQFIHYTVFGIGYLEKMNFVTQPSVELYKAITNRLFTEAQQAGGVERTEAWRRAFCSDRSLPFNGAVTLHANLLPDSLLPEGGSPAQAYGCLLRELSQHRTIEYGELTFFGDMRYSRRGKAMRKSLDRAADTLFRTRLKMPVDVYEGPAMNHSYHEMIIGHGRCLSTVILSELPETIPAAGYTAEYHRAQFLATQLALAERGRHVVALTVRDLDEKSLTVLDQFFHQAAQAAKAKVTA